MLKMSEKGVAHVALVEGCVKSGDLHKMYKDIVGLQTLGYGHLLTKSELTSGKVYINSAPVEWKKGLNEKQAQALLDQDLDRFENIVNNVVKVELAQHQFEALVSFVFNIGGSAFQNSTLLKRVNSHDWDDVPNQFMRWVYAGGKKVKGLANRREKEISLWNGHYEA